jgi:hypothetical protein
MPDITYTPKPDLSKHEEEVIPFDDVLRRLLEAKPQKAEPPNPKTMLKNEDSAVQ